MTSPHHSSTVVISIPFFFNVFITIRHHFSPSHETSWKERLSVCGWTSPVLSRAGSQSDLFQLRAHSTPDCHLVPLTPRGLWVKMSLLTRAAPVFFFYLPLLFHDCLLHAASLNFSTASPNQNHIPVLQSISLTYYVWQ